MSLDQQIKKDGIAFFTEALRKWNRLIELYNHVFTSPYQLSYTISPPVNREANEIIAWFQEKYMEHKKYSKFGLTQVLPDGRKVEGDPILDVVFRGGAFGNICRHHSEFVDDLNQGHGFLRGHLASIRNLTTLEGESELEQAPLLRVIRTLSRCNLVIEQLRRKRKDKVPYIIKDEYDIQDLLHALLKLDFDDIRKEEWTPSYAGGSSRMDLLLKKEKIVVEVKKTSETLREEGIGKQLLVDIVKYKEHQDSDTLVCFIYDPEHWIENPEGLKHDLEKESTQELKVYVIICSK